MGFIVADLVEDTVDVVIVLVEEILVAFIAAELVTIVGTDDGITTVLVEVTLMVGLEDVLVEVMVSSIKERTCGSNAI